MNLDVIFGMRGQYAMKRGRRSKFPMFTKKASFVCLGGREDACAPLKTSKIEDIDADVESKDGRKDEHFAFVHVASRGELSDTTQ